MKRALLTTEHEKCAEIFILQTSSQSALVPDAIIFIGTVHAHVRRIATLWYDVTGTTNQERGISMVT
jgi:ribosomal silencing factor RsfS